MAKKIIFSGLLGGIVLIFCTVITNMLLPFRSSIAMKQIPDERQVYEFLKERIVEPGRYICNPEMSSIGSFPADEPVFSIHYSGIGHESASTVFLLQLFIAFIAPMIAAWMLSVTSERILSSYSRKVLFFAAIGLLFAIFSDLMKFDIGAYPLNYALILAAYDIITWTLTGLVVAWLLKPEPAVVTHS